MLTEITNTVKVKSSKIMKIIFLFEIGYAVHPLYNEGETSKGAI